MIGKGGNVVVTAVGGEGDTIAIHGSPVTGWHKNIQGSLFGGANPLYDMPRLLGLYKNGDLKLDELITNRYTLDDINQGYEDMLVRPQHPRRPHPRPLMPSTPSRPTVQNPRNRSHRVRHPHISASQTLICGSRPRAGRFCGFCTPTTRTEASP